MVFPVSGVEVNPLILPLIALVVSTFISMAGVSGAFLLLPFQVSILNFSNHSIIPAIPGRLVSTPRHPDNRDLSLQWSTPCQR
jgi:hypothetical protein